MSRQDMPRERFMRQCIAAGVTDYIQLIESRQILYLGAKGEIYVEDFPGVSRDPSLFVPYEKDMPRKCLGV